MLDPMEDHIPLYRPFLAGNEKKYVNDCLDSTWISSRGHFIEQFESAFCQYTGLEAACSVSNGTVAIHVALAALGIGPGDEVLVSGLTYVASVNPILQVGAVPVYVDIDPESWQLDPVDLQRKLTPRSRCLIVVHLYGAAAPMPAIAAICRDRNILIIEDCAEAIGTEVDGQHVGALSDLATFSFYGNKTLTTGEGGMVASNNSTLIDNVTYLKQQAVDPEREYWHSSLGFNYRMTNICAAIGLAQLENISAVLDRKRVIAQRYAEQLRSLPLMVHGEVANTVHSFWLVGILLHDASHRDSLRRFLADQGIETRPFFYPVNTLPHLINGQHLPVAENIAQRGVCLPSFPGLEDLQQSRVIHAITAYFIEKSEAEASKKRAAY